MLQVILQALKKHQLLWKKADWLEKSLPGGLGYLDKPEFNSYFDEISTRLKELRLGSFGIEREKGKKLLLDSANPLAGVYV